MWWYLICTIYIYRLESLFSRKYKVVVYESCHQMGVPAVTAGSLNANCNCQINWALHIFSYKLHQILLLAFGLIQNHKHEMLISIRLLIACCASPRWQWRTLWVAYYSLHKSSSCGNISFEIFDLVSPAKIKGNME